MEEQWLQQHGLGDAPATPVLVARLAVRRRARLVSHIMLAGLFVMAALGQAYEMSDPRHPAHVVIPAIAVAGLLVTQFRLDRWVRRVDAQVGATLSRRATHPVHPGWRDLLGRPYAILTAGTFAGALALAVSALAVSESRSSALILLTAVSGVGALAAVQVRHGLIRPVVADDEASLTADVVMRIEDARDTNVPSVLWALPVVLLAGTAPAWWAVASFVFMLVGLAGLVVISLKAPCSGAVARRVVGIQ
jgi:hypothetical protein